MRKYNPFYFVSEAFKSLKRNGVMTFASIAVLMSCLIVINGFYLLFANINFNLERFENANIIVVYCNADSSEEQIVEVQNKIFALDNIDTVVRTTKKEQLDKYKEENPDAFGDITDEENPLSDCFTITYKSIDGVAELDYQLHQLEGIKKVRNILEFTNKITAIKKTIVLIFTWFLVILFVVSVFIIVNTVKLTVNARRKEIRIMQNIGATGWFISLPFLIESIVIGLISGVLSFFLIRLGYGYIINQIQFNVSMIGVLDFASMSGRMILVSLGVGVGTGVLGGCISLAKYLKE